MNERHIDCASGTVYARLTTERASKRHGRITVNDDVSWQVDHATTLHTAVLYGHVRIRDWRWLWLRRKTISFPLTTADLRSIR